MKVTDSVRAVHRWSGLLLTLVVIAGACTDDGDDAPETTVPTAVSTSPPTTQVGIDTIPDVIDEPYLNRVLAALEKVETAAVQVIAQTKDFPPEAAEIFSSIYSDEWFPTVADSWFSQLQQDPELKGLRYPVGERQTTVDRLIVASSRCVWIAVRRDYSNTDVNPGEPSLEYMALQPLDPTNDPKDRNPTAWMIINDGFRQDGSEPPNPCPAS